jgi:hypothetical protein
MHNIEITSTPLLQWLNMYTAVCFFCIQRCVVSRESRKILGNNNKDEISGSHGGDYEAQNLLGCTAVFLIER